MSIYIVTGAAGFIGFHLCKRLLDNGDRVVGIDSINDYYDPRLKYARLEQLGILGTHVEYGKPIKSSQYHGFTFFRQNLEDAPLLSGLVSETQPDCFINLAAQAGVRYSIDHPFDYAQSNLVGFLSVLEACRHNKVSHLVYASSSSVYGMNSKVPFNEHDPVDHPASLYAATKRSNELMAHTYSHLYGLPTTGLRFFTVYGPWGRPDMAYFKFARAIMKGDPIEVYNNGDMYRDFTYIDDIIEGMLCVIKKPAQTAADCNLLKTDAASSSTPYTIYNIGNNKPESLSDFIALLEQALGKKAEKRYLPMQPGDVYRTAADITAIAQDFDWRPRTSIETGLKHFAKWFVSYYTTGKTYEAG